TRASSWAGAHAPASLPRFRLDRADAMVEAGMADARAIYESILPAGAALPGGDARIRLGLARALILAGDQSAAFPHLRHVASALDAPAPAGTPRPEYFWHAWCLMLELLADQNKDGARSGSIRAQIRRLETIDPELGGEPWRGRIKGVGKRVE